MFNKLMFIILIFGSTNALSYQKRCYNLFQDEDFNYKTEFNYSCKPPEITEKKFLVQLTFIRDADFGLPGAEYEVLIPKVSLFTTTKMRLDTSSNMFVYGLLNIEGVKKLFEENKKVDQDQRNVAQTDVNTNEDSDSKKSISVLTQENEANKAKLLAVNNKAKDLDAAFKHAQTVNGSGNTLLDKYQGELSEEDKTAAQGMINKNKEILASIEKSESSLGDKTIEVYINGKKGTTKINTYVKNGNGSWSVNPDLDSKIVKNSGEMQKAISTIDAINVKKTQLIAGVEKSESFVKASVEKKIALEKNEVIKMSDESNNELGSQLASVVNKKTLECESKLRECLKPENKSKESCSEEELFDIPAETPVSKVELDKFKSAKGIDKCSEWGSLVAKNEPEYQEGLNSFQQGIADYDNEVELGLEAGEAKESTLAELRNLLEGSSFSPANCGEFIDNEEYKKDMIKNGHFLGFLRVTLDSGTEKGKPESFVIPGECLDKSLFKSKQYDLFTDYEKTIVDQMKPRARLNICNGMTYHSEQEDYAQGDSCHSKLQSAQKCQKSFTTMNGINFKDPVVCEEYYWNEFKGCMGFEHEIVDKGAESYQKGTYDIAQVNKEWATKAMVNEIDRQYKPCIAFREVSRDIKESVGKWEGVEDFNSIDGRFTCRRVRPWTMDFKACKRLVNTYNGFIVGDQARGLANQGWTMNESRKIQKKATSEMGSGNQLNAGLDAQKSTLLHRRDQERGNTVFFTAQAAVITGQLLGYPTPKTVSRKCSPDTTESGVSGSHYCAVVTAWEEHPDIKNNELFPNEDIKKQMWSEVMKASSSAVLAAIKQGQFNKMAGDIKKIKEAFGGLEDKSTTKDSQIELSYCKFNPTAPTCRTSGPRVTRGGGFQYGNISTQGAGGAVNIAGNDTAFGEYDEGEDSAAKRAAIQDLGGMIDNTSADSFDNKFNKIGAGSFAKKGLGGGGGGGGGAAGGGGGGGGGAGPAKAGAQNKFAVNKSGGTGRFQSGTGGKSGFGSGGSSSKKSASKNPFSNMFGSKKGRNVASQVSNDIAPANSALFDKISKRYSKVAAENRLINLQGLTK
jgi:hypothetical protein